MANPLIAALEIGSSNTTLLVGEPDANGRMHVEGAGRVTSMGVRKGQIVNFDHAVQCITQAVGKVTEKKFDVGRVLIAAGGGYIGSFSNHGSTPVRSRNQVVSLDDIEDVRELAGSVTLPSPTAARMHTIPQKFRLDGQTGIVRPEGLKGTTLSLGMLVVHAERGPVENLKNAAAAASLDVEDIVFSAYAASFAVLSQEQRDAGVAVVDLGGGTTNAMAFVDGVPADAWSIGVGGDHVTNDVRSAFSLTQAQAEQLKRNASALVGIHEGPARLTVAAATPGFDPVTISRRALETVVNARLQELFAVILDDLDRANLSHRFNGGIVLTGGVTATPGLPQLAEHVFGRRARVGTFVSDIVALEDGPAPASYATVAGLLLTTLRGLEPRGDGNTFKRIFGGLFG